MESRQEFHKRIRQILAGFDPEALAYDQDEFWMIEPLYQTIEYYAGRRGLQNTAIALPLVRGLHNGVHRKASIMRDGVAYRLPYSFHPLMVCRMLIDMQIPLPYEERDILLAAALCHDMIEDVDFPEKGMELITKFHLDPRVYETVKYVSKRKDFTPEEEAVFLHNIEAHPLALLVKLCDRGHNVEDLYDMKLWKVHEYVDETRTHFLPMCGYGREHYPELQGSIDILEDKIRCLTEVAEALVDRYHEREEEMHARVEELREKNRRLREIFNKQWEEGL